MRIEYMNGMAVGVPENSADIRKLIMMSSEKSEVPIEAAPRKKWEHKTHKKHKYNKKCPECGGIFRGVGGLKMHTNRTHLGKTWRSGGYRATPVPSPETPTFNQ